VRIECQTIVGKMISTYQLKTRFQTVLRPLAGRLHRAGVTPNQITVGACLISLALGIITLALPDHNYLFLLISFWCLLRMAANALDGMLAREFGQSSRLGAVLNEFGDVISDVALYLPFAFVAGSQPWLIVGVLFLAGCSELVGWLGTVMRNERGNHGPMGKSDRALMFGVLALLLGCGVPVGPFINQLWLVTAALLIITIFNRGRFISAVRNAGNTR
jgi:CDP-diacylglycerol--glycerol-3-phosphate 3-phosphatidyltransferase